MKLAVITKASGLFKLSEHECEMLANRAGLSFGGQRKALKHILKNYCGKQCSLLLQASVSERMFEYYLHGVQPTKQALLAIGISAELPHEDIAALLLDYGYCFSLSIASDAVVRWYLFNYSHLGYGLLMRINETLDELKLPLIMTKLIDR